MDNMEKAKRPGFFQESDGSFSYRRLQGFIYGIYALGLYLIAAIHNTQWAFWAGVACTAASIVYPILTTAEEIKEVAAAAAGIVNHNDSHDAYNRSTGEVK
jgi:hypothetical protein